MLLIASGNTYAVMTFYNPPIMTPQQTNPFAGLVDNTLHTMMLVEEVKSQQLQNEMMEQKFEEERRAATSLLANRTVIIVGQGAKTVNLGCVNCDNRSLYSIHNSQGRYGSRSGVKSIFNSSGKYGSPESDYSPCNPDATHPPIIEDTNGGVYGLLTMNTRLPGALIAPGIQGWLTSRVCKHFE